MSSEKPEFEEIIAEGVSDVADTMRDAIERQGRLELTNEEMDDILGMDEAILAEFFSAKGVDFNNPVVLHTPNGVAEPPMYSPEDVKEWIRRVRTH
jgi:hypothetical protein